MSYKALVDSNVTLAFNLLKDLAVDATLSKSGTVTFDFDTASNVESTRAELPIKAVVVDDDKKSDKSNSIVRQLLFKTRGLGDLNAYDRINIDGHEWQFGPLINNDGYTILAEIYREV